MSDGGYDIGYKTCCCFWGREPGSLIRILETTIKDFKDISVLDVGCGEGKNSVYLASKGAIVDALDISESAIKNAHLVWGNCKGINWEVCDVRTKTFKKAQYDIVIAYGLFHCFSNKEEVMTVIKKLKQSTKNNGYNIICAFNNRRHDLSAHSGFTPLLLNHDFYLRVYSDFNIIFSSDEDLYETHPHNEIPHYHSMTRIIARKG